MRRKAVLGLLLVALILPAGCGNTAAEPAPAAESKENTVDTAAPAAEATPAAENEGDTSAAEGTSDSDLSTELFTLPMPEALAGTYIVKHEGNGISIYEKEAHEDGFGGFAFSVESYATPSDYAGGMDVKVGELTAADGKLYDIVMSFPSDVQFNYEKYQEGMPESYDKLYSGARDFVKELKPADGGTFVWGGGTKGEDLYAEVLAKHMQAVKENWDSDRLEKEGMSIEYYVMSQDGRGDPMDRIGFYYKDINADGIDELLIGEISDVPEWQGVIYDVYTMVDRKPAHVVSGWSRNRYYTMEYGWLTNEYSNGAAESGMTSYDVTPNTTELYPQVGIKYDEYTNEKQPWFIAYGMDITNDKWENTTEEEYNDRMKTMVDYLKLQYTPLSSLK